MIYSQLIYIESIFREEKNILLLGCYISKMGVIKEAQNVFLNQVVFNYIFCYFVLKRHNMPPQSSHVGLSSGVLPRDMVAVSH